MKGEILEINGICRVCSGAVPFVIENATQQQAKYDSWMRATGTCPDCGTWFRAVELIDKYLITGEASVPTKSYRDYRLERQAKLKTDREGIGTGQSH